MTTMSVADAVFAPRPLPTAGDPGWLRERRDSAFSRFRDLGFPTPHDEAWRYTGVQPITGTDWQPSDCAWELASPAPAGVRIRPLAQALTAAESRLACLLDGDGHAFAALNTALFRDATIVEILPGAVVKDPIALALRRRGTRTDGVFSPRLLVLAGERSEARIVQTFAGEGRAFVNGVTEIAVAEGAILEHTLLQQESRDTLHVHSIAARQARASRYTSVQIALGAALARTDLGVRFEDEGAECELFGLFVGGGSQHLDLHTSIDHAKPRCTSRELYKGILDGSARGVFHGTILVRKDAQKTDAVQTNKNLLLSRHALVNSTPALEILADDVKCRHGSTTGQLDANALFYLRSRGIGEDAARALLTWAFAADVADRIRVAPVRAEVERALGLVLGSPAEVSA